MLSKMENGSTKLNSTSGSSINSSFSSSRSSKSKRSQDKRGFTFVRISRNKDDEKDDKRSETESVSSKEGLSSEEKFSGQGIVYKGKLIGVDPVAGPRGDKMCQSSMQRLKALVKETGSHKQRITIQISLDGVCLKDEKTGEVVSSHTIPMISYISRDITDKRAFGFVYGSPDTGHQFVGIKTEKSAVPVMKTIGELFTYVYEQKKRAQSVVSHGSNNSCDNQVSSQSNINFASTGPLSTQGDSTNCDSKNKDVFGNDPFMEISNLKELISSVKVASDPYANWESFDSSFDSYGKITHSNSISSSMNVSKTESSLSLSCDAPFPPPQSSSPPRSPKPHLTDSAIRIKPPISTSRRHRDNQVSCPQINSYASLDEIFRGQAETHKSDISTPFSGSNLFNSTPMHSSVASTDQPVNISNQFVSPVNTNPFSLPVNNQFSTPLNENSASPAVSNSGSEINFAKNFQAPLNASSDDRYAVFSEINSIPSIFDQFEKETERKQGEEQGQNKNQWQHCFDETFNKNTNPYSSPFEDSDQRFNNFFNNFSSNSATFDQKSLSSSSSPACFTEQNSQNFCVFPKPNDNSASQKPFDPFGMSSVFADLDPLGVGKLKPFKDKSGFFEDLKQPKNSGFTSITALLTGQEDGQSGSSDRVKANKTVGASEGSSLFVCPASSQSQEVRSSSSASAASRNPFLSDTLSDTCSSDDLFANSPAFASPMSGNNNDSSSTSPFLNDTQPSLRDTQSQEFSQIINSPKLKNSFDHSSSVFQPIVAESSTSSWEFPSFENASTMEADPFSVDSVIASFASAVNVPSTSLTPVSSAANAFGEGSKGNSSPFPPPPRPPPRETHDTYLSSEKTPPRIPPRPLKNLSDAPPPPLPKRKPNIYCKT